MIVELFNAIALSSCIVSNSTFVCEISSTRKFGKLWIKDIFVNCSILPIYNSCKPVNVWTISLICSSGMLVLPFNLNDFTLVFPLKNSRLVNALFPPKSTISTLSAIEVISPSFKFSPL